MASPIPSQLTRLCGLATSRGSLLLVPIVLFGGWLRLEDLDTWWINADEGIYYSMTAWSDWARFWVECAGNAHPPLYYLLLRAVAVFTDSIAGMRALALVCGTLAIPAAWWLMREAMGGGGRLAALVAASVVALSPNLIVQSQLMRPYMLLLLLVTAAAAALCCWLRTRQRWALVSYSGLLGLAILTHYSALLLAAVTGVTGAVAVLRRPPPRAIVALGLAHVAPVAIAVALYVLHLRPHLMGSALEKEAVEGWLARYMVTGLQSAWQAVLGFFAYVGGEGFEGPLTLLFTLGLGIAARQRRWLILALPLALVLLALAAAAGHRYPFGCTRHASWMTSIVILPVAATIAAALTASWRLALPAVLALVALTVWRQPVSSAMGAQPDLMHPAFERVLRTADLARVQAIWSGIPRTAGTLLMGSQTYFMLVPILRHERETARQSSDGSFRWFPWGERTVLIATAWDITIDPADAKLPNHIDNLARSIDRELPQLGFATSHEVLMLFAGWSWVVPKVLFDYDARRPKDRALIKNPLRVPGLTVFDYDLATFRQEIQPQLEKHR